MNLFELFVKIIARDEASKPIETIAKASKNASGEVEKASQTVANRIAAMSESWSNLGEKLGSGLKTAAKIGAAAVGAAATAVVALTKSAVENYAEHEQLVGGVETLFGEASDTVVEYADEAYKTAGLSANEYMETVTGFSASLLQALGRGAQTNLEELEETLDAEYEATKQTYEDEYDALKASWDAKLALAKKEKRNNQAELEAQRDDELKQLKRTQEESLKVLKSSNAAKLAEAEKANNASETTAESQALAAEKANLAVIDMADNANKMGTDIASIQNAYQGFAKQNYTINNLMSAA